MNTLVDILNLEQLDLNLFRSRAHQVNMSGRLYGGQVLAQSLIAAQLTVEDRQAHSMHAYFLRAGSGETPVIYDVERIRDGGSFTTRRVLARQSGRVIFNAAISFHKQEPGFEHQMPAVDMPNLPTTEEVEAHRAARSAFEKPHKTLKKSPVSRLFDFIPVGDTPFASENVTDPNGAFWFRCTEELPGDINVQRGALTYASDMGLLAAALFPHPTTFFNRKQMVASLDHALWFHDNTNLNDWLLFQVDSPWAGNARGFTRGLIYTANGELIASATQEGLIRPLQQ
ncbi:MAG: acyl-CoA thioesterase II [Gammaproteobacteria bacterium]|nr:acyl-CoA thioesterase II [Gammaproteobacteria bacterium]